MIRNHLNVISKNVEEALRHEEVFWGFLMKRKHPKRCRKPEEKGFEIAKEIVNN